MRTKRKLAFCVLVLFTSCLRTIAQTLVLHHADGTTTDVELFTQPLVMFQGNKVLITSAVLDMEYPKEDILRFTYQKSSQGIATPRANANISRDGDRLVFHNVKPKDEVAIYKTNGIRVPVRFNRNGTDVAISLSAIPSGVYLLSVNGRTSKFQKP